MNALIGVLKLTDIEYKFFALRVIPPARPVPMEAKKKQLKKYQNYRATWNPNRDQKLPKWIPKRYLFRKATGMRKWGQPGSRNPQNGANMGTKWRPIVGSPKASKMDMAVKAEKPSEC